MQEFADNNCFYRNEVNHFVGERTQVLQDMVADPTLPRIKAVRCVKCQHGEAVFFQVKFLFHYVFWFMFLFIVDFKFLMKPLWFISFSIFHFWSVRLVLGLQCACSSISFFFELVSNI